MEEEEILKIDQLLTEPNPCPLQAPLNISMKYKLLKPVTEAIWTLVYEADYTNKRHVINLYQSDAASAMDVGDHTLTCTVPELRTEGVKEKYLLQLGVLKLELRGGKNSEENVASINMVTQVSKNATSGELIRDIMNPLE